MAARPGQQILPIPIEPTETVKVTGFLTPGCITTYDLIPSNTRLFMCSTRTYPTPTALWHSTRFRSLSTFCVNPSVQQTRNSLSTISLRQMKSFVLRINPQRRIEVLKYLRTFYSTSKSILGETIDPVWERVFISLVMMIVWLMIPVLLYTIPVYGFGSCLGRGEFCWR